MADNVCIHQGLHQIDSRPALQCMECLHIIVLHIHPDHQRLKADITRILLLAVICGRVRASHICNRAQHILDIRALVLWVRSVLVVVVQAVVVVAHKHHQFMAVREVALRANM
jgi:hypothetical protein